MLLGKQKTAGGFIFEFVENQMHKVNSANCIKKIVQYDLQMNKINEFNSQKEASTKLKINKTSISKCCLGKAKTAGGFIFKFAHI